MTIDEFIETLPTDGWCFVIDYDGKRQLRHLVGKIMCCPITVNYGEHAGLWDIAAEKMGLQILDAVSVVSAADDAGQPELRAKLLKHCGIEE